MIRWTAFACVAAMITAVVYDVIAISIGGVEASISAWFNSFREYPVVVFGCGFLAGHFLAPIVVASNKQEKKDG